MMGHSFIVMESEEYPETGRRIELLNDEVILSQDQLELARNEALKTLEINHRKEFDDLVRKREEAILKETKDFLTSYFNEVLNLKENKLKLISLSEGPLPNTRIVKLKKGIKIKKGQAVTHDMIETKQIMDKEGNIKTHRAYKFYGE